MPVNVGQLITRNWPVKLAALFFAVMLYVAVAAQQPLTQLFALQLEVTAPPGRALKQPPTEISVLLTGKGGELLKLRSLPRVIRKTVPDTFSGTVWHVRLQSSDVPIPKGVDVQVADLGPRDVDVGLDSAARREVRIVARVTLHADSTFVLQGLAVHPATARLVGPPKSLNGIDSLVTERITISGPGHFSRAVDLDTSGVGVARVIPTGVLVSGEVAAVTQRSFPGVSSRTAASGFAGFTLARERVVVQTYGPASRVESLTRDSLRVIAHLVGHAGPDAYARLSVVSPAGITARAEPDSVGLRQLAPPKEPKPPKETKPRRPPKSPSARAAVADVVLGIETSCDDTSAALLVSDNGRHAREPGDPVTGRARDIRRCRAGTCQSRACAALPPVVDRALDEAGVRVRGLDGVAVTSAPGLVGALLVGVMYGKTLAWSLDCRSSGSIIWRATCLRRRSKIRGWRPPSWRCWSAAVTPCCSTFQRGDSTGCWAQTIDDAAGEAFDKVAKLLGLGYPGGPHIERLARDGRAGRFKFPRPMLREMDRPGPQQYAFSFSGLKTAVLRAVQQSTDIDADRADLALAFQDAALDVLVEKTAHAADSLRYGTVVLGGGVACNQALAERMPRSAAVAPARVAVASPRLNTDNAAMIAAAGAWRLEPGERSGWDLEPRDALPLPGLSLSPSRSMHPHDHLSVHDPPRRPPITGFGLMMMFAFLVAGGSCGST